MFRFLLLLISARKLTELKSRNQQNGIFFWKFEGKINSLVYPGFLGTVHFLGHRTKTQSALKAFREVLSSY